MPPFGNPAVMGAFVPLDPWLCVSGFPRICRFRGAVGSIGVLLGAFSDFLAGFPQGGRGSGGMV
jgi:hypothetical protein